MGIGPMTDALPGYPDAVLAGYGPILKRQDHAFARDGGDHYDRANAELANGRTSTFFRQHLS